MKMPKNLKPISEEKREKFNAIVREVSKKVENLFHAENCKLIHTLKGRNFDEDYFLAQKFLMVEYHKILDELNYNFEELNEFVNLRKNNFVSVYIVAEEKEINCGATYEEKDIAKANGARWNGEFWYVDSFDKAIEIAKKLAE